MINRAIAFATVLLMAGLSSLPSGAIGPPQPGSFILIPLADIPPAADGKSPIELSAPADGVLFDLDGDGAAEQVSWPTRPSTVAFLAVDRNGSGAIENGTELFGAQTISGVNWGFTALEKIESNNGDGAIDRIDAIFSKLLLWADTNSNGRSEASELMRANTSLAKIGLGYSDMSHRDRHGNRFENRGWVVFVKDQKDSAPEQVSPAYEVFPSVRASPIR